ncbi:MAG: hypothetical protein AAB613_03085 [Patescibacteria group bacterium]
MRNGNFILKILFLLIIVSFFSVLPAKGQGAISPSLSISPGLVRQTVKPGASAVVKLKISNLGEDPIPLSVSKLNISRISDLGAPEFTTEVTPRSGADWLVVSRPDMIVDAKSDKEIEVTITAPRGTAPGGYSAVLVFQARLPSYYFDLDANAHILPALTSSFLITIDSNNPPTIQDLSISSFQTPNVVVSTPVPIVTEINNPTAFFIYTDGELVIAPLWGDKKVVTKLASSVLMPESSRKYINAYSETIWPGVYTAKMTLNQGDKVLVASARFVAIPWPFIVLVIFVAIFIAGLTVYYRRRARRVPR